MMALQSVDAAQSALMDLNSELVTTVISPVFFGVVATRQPKHVLRAANAPTEIMWRQTEQAQSGDTVKVAYTGKLSDGTVCVGTASRDPLQFTIGRGRIIPGVEQAVIGMRPGQRKTVTLYPPQAYGKHREGMLIAVDRSRVEAESELRVGQRLRAAGNNGRGISVTVADVSESKVILDTNHPLAGKTITFDIKLVHIA
ncbi:MAG: FKBP-type peptidyl-prolyl cis-trans isomerase [Planctomycetota bacterium]|jgi:peptidylprolyl isomerase